MCLLKQLCASSHGSRGRKIKGPGLCPPICKIEQETGECTLPVKGIGRCKYLHQAVIVPGTKWSQQMVEQYQKEERMANKKK